MYIALIVLNRVSGYKTIRLANFHQSMQKLSWISGIILFGYLSHIFFVYHKWFYDQTPFFLQCFCFWIWSSLIFWRRGTKLILKKQKCCYQYNFFYESCQTKIVGHWMTVKNSALFCHIFITRGQFWQGCWHCLSTRHLSLVEKHQLYSTP